MLGEYALALALTAPLAMLSHLNLRSVLATDAAHRHPFRHYLDVRAAVSAAALAAMGVVAWISSDTATFAFVVFFTGASQVAETFSDLYYGAMQRREHMHRVGQSMIVRTAVSLVAVGLVLQATGNLLYSVATLAAARVAVFLLMDTRAVPPGQESAALQGDVTPGEHSRRTILRQALPLGLILMLISLNTHLPRYAVQHSLGTADLGGFAAVVTLITVGSTLMNAMGQSATARLARSIQAGDHAAFRALLGRIVCLAVALGLLAISAAHMLGGWLLQFLYRPEFAAYQPLLVAAMAAGTLSYVAVALGYGVTSARIFDAQLPLFAASAAVCGLASWLLVPRWGLLGAVAAMAMATLPQIAGQFFLLRRVMRAREVAA